MPTTAVSWNTTKGHEAWRPQLQMDVDIALPPKAGSMPQPIWLAKSTLAQSTIGIRTSEICVGTRPS